MAYLAISRKWRPQSFDDVIGQAHVVTTLKNAIAQNRVAHAYLFSGPRGTGKTSVARIFAKAIRGTESNPEEANQIAEGRSLDVVEIDGASNNGVEAIRNIRENVAYGASSGQYKIYIIDEVHMLSISAFNALLKTLEEPPPHVIFIFATTEAHKIPLTILSRCQHFEFRRFTNEQIVTCLKKILDSDNIKIEEAGLRVIASQSEGALRDAQSLLDQVLSTLGNEQTDKSYSEDDVVRSLGVSHSSTVRQFIKAVLERNITQTHQIIQDIYFSGIDLKHFGVRTLEELRMLYLVALAKESNSALTAEDLDISSGQLEELDSLLKDSSVLQLERMAQVLSKAISQISWAAIPRFVLEMAAVRMSRIGNLDQIEKNLLSAQISIPETKNLETPVAQPSAPPIAEPAPSGPQSPNPPPPAGVNSSAPVAPANSTQSSWKTFVEFAMKKRPLLGAVLSHASFNLESNDGTPSKLKIAFEEGSFYEKQVTDQKSRADIESLVKAHFGDSVQIELGNTLDNAHESLEQTRQTETAALKKKALEHPAVNQAKDMLGAEVVSVNVEN